MVSHTAQPAVGPGVSGRTPDAPGTAATAVRGAPASCSSATGLGSAVGPPPTRYAASSSRPAARFATGTSLGGSATTANMVPAVLATTSFSFVQSVADVNVPCAATPPSTSSASSTPANAARRCERSCSCSSTVSPRTSAASMRRIPKR